MENLFSIGELSKYQNISKQTLIFYDRIGLFCPAYVDPDNGYRYYSANQIDYLDTILIMKKIGFSLREIREHMQNYNIDSSLAALGKQLTVLDDRIQELRLIRSRLVHRCRQMEEARSYLGKEGPAAAGEARSCLGKEGPAAAGEARSCLGKEGPAAVEEVEARYILWQEVEEPCSLREISIATKKCFAQAFEKQLPIFFQSGVTVPLGRIREGRYTEASTAFLPIERTDRVENVRELPAGTCASIYHVGDYLSIGSSYQKLLRYCEENGWRIVSDSYEFCVNDYITTHDEAEYITKIMFYVEKISQ